MPAEKQNAKSYKQAVMRAKTIIMRVKTKNFLLKKKIDDLKKEKEDLYKNYLNQINNNNLLTNGDKADLAGFLSTYLNQTEI